MSESITRRDAIRRTALSLTAVGIGSLLPARLPEGGGQMVHAALQEAGAGEAPRAFLEHEWRLLRLLAEMILPADEVSGSALDAGAPEFIDLLASNNDELRRILSSGMLWLDHEMRARSGTSFVDADEPARRALLDRLAARTEEADPGYEGYAESIEYAGFQHYTTEPADEMGAGVRFFSWVRRLVVDAFYTSPIGLADVDYQGNDYLRRFTVPEAPLHYALERSPLRDD